MTTIHLENTKYSHFCFFF